jgi:hypothetical protein
VSGCYPYPPPHARPPAKVDHVIQRISRNFYARDPQADWIPSDEADVFRLRFDDLDPPRILKIERADRWVVRREQVAFPRLRAYGFSEFPEVEFTQADWREDGPSFMLMPETSWRPLHELWDEDERVAVEVVRRMGSFLARLSSVDWRDIPGAVSPTVKSQSYLQWYTEWLRPLREHPGMRGPAEIAMTKALEMVAEEPRGFGGWQGAQVLTDGHTAFTAIDWPNIGAHWPLEDVAGAIVSLANYGPAAPEVLRPVLIDSWTSGRGLVDHEQTELQLWLILWRLHGAAGLLRKGSVGEAEQAIDPVRELIESGFPHI